MTVSRVVNGEPHVSPEVRDRVLRGVEELGYRPSNAARARLLGRYRRIAVVSLGSALYGPAALLLAPGAGRAPDRLRLPLAGTLEGQPAQAAVEAPRHGAGRITYVGTVPDPAFTRAGIGGLDAADQRATASGSASCTTGRGRRWSLPCPRLYGMC